MSIFSKPQIVGCFTFTFISLVAGTALAGGFSIREQSTSGLGAAFAGNAAGYDLSTIYWNPAGVAIAGPGLTTESHYAVILPDSEIDPFDNQALTSGVSPFGGTFGPLSAAGNDIDKVAFVPSSYGAWRINDKLTIGYGFNAPFGLATEADDKVWSGQYDFREADLKTYNFNPVVGYQLTSTLSVGVGLQVQYTDLNLKQAIIPPPAVFGVVPSSAHPSANVKIDDWSVGFTAGLLWRPLQGTSIGVGYRSRINNTLEGTLDVDGFAIPRQNVEADFDLPEIVTVSLRQDLTPNMRLLGTFEWTNWSILGDVVLRNKDTGAAVQTINPGTLTGGPLTVEANWDDGYFLSGGLEYDYNEQVTLRGGVAYEWSPVQEPTQRLTPVPDTDRIWLSIGATYKYSETTSFDFAYTHIFMDDETLLRPTGFAAGVDSSVDIIGVSFKTKWGKEGPFGLLSGLTN